MDNTQDRLSSSTTWDIGVTNYLPLGYQNKDKKVPNLAYHCYHGQESSTKMTYYLLLLEPRVLFYYKSGNWVKCVTRKCRPEQIIGGYYK